MAEVQKQDPATAGEMTQRFVQFIIMQAQQILFVLGNPTPEGDAMPPNLEGARMLIDQLEMIREKTKGNLNAQEAKLMEEALSRVQLAFVQASGGTPASMMPRHAHPDYPMPEVPEEEEASAPVPQPEPPRAAEKTAAPASTPSAPTSSPAPTEAESKKKFTKSYG